MSANVNATTKQIRFRDINNALYHLRTVGMTSPNLDRERAAPSFLLSCSFVSFDYYHYIHYLFHVKLHPPLMFHPLYLPLISSYPNYYPSSSLFVPATVLHCNVLRSGSVARACNHVHTPPFSMDSSRQDALPLFTNCPRSSRSMTW